MGFEKPKRKVDERFLELVRCCRCLACGAQPPSDAHHIRSKGAGGGDDSWNVVPLCRWCHSAFHALGWKEFMEKRPGFWKRLEEVGWYVHAGKLFHPRLAVGDGAR